MNTIHQGPALLPAGRTFFGHPLGLGPLSFAGSFERFAYYGMQSLLVLYMTHWLLQPDHVGQVWGLAALERLLGNGDMHQSPQKLASYIFGFYAGLAYLTPIIGGAIADRWVGKTRAVVAGAVMMTIGHILMAFDRTFLLALLFLLLGLGAFRSNHAGQIGALYRAGDERRSDGFQLYMFGVQIAGILAPLVCGSLGQDVAWRWGFTAAGVGMTIGLIIYVAGLGTIPVNSPARAGNQPVQLTKHDVRNIAILILLLPVLTITQIGNQQTFNAYLIWGEANYDLMLFGHMLPITWLLSFGAVISTVVMGLSVAFWRAWGRRRPEPSELAKLTIGAAFSALAPLALAIATKNAGAPHQVALGWALAFHILNNIGFAHSLPVALALYSRMAPRGTCGTMIALCYLHLFAANLLVGWLGAMYEPSSAVSFWLLHSGLIAGAAIVLLGVWLVLGGQFAAGPQKLTDRATTIRDSLEAIAE